jgi:2-phosphosulfolactate phosphatase
VAEWADVRPEYLQRPFDVRLEWGPPGAEVLRDVACAVVVDVLSFTTAVTVAVERGVAVHPFRWRDERAAAYAAEVGATLAVGRLEAAREGVAGVSLSPAAMARVEGVARIVLPSPNGSTISTALAGSGATVVAACLRNAPAVAAWLADRGPIAVIPAGERWSFETPPSSAPQGSPEDTLRPAVEDLWGAGAVVAGLLDAGLSASPEARAAAAAFRAADLPGELQECVSGRELREKGFAEDVAVAGEYGASPVVPVLVDNAFLAHGAVGGRW